MPLEARSKIALNDAERYLGGICRHFAEHDLKVDGQGASRSIAFSRAAADLMANESGLSIRVRADSELALEDMKSFLTSHVGEFVDDQPVDIGWEGDGAARAGLPNFREMSVVAASDLTPHMRRITLQGSDLARFDTSEHLHVKLLFPLDANRQATQWPVMGHDGRTVWPQGDAQLVARKYTIRSIDPAAGTMDIDFVVHDTFGPGSAFAARAQAGDKVGCFGPGGLGYHEADWHLIAGDETAIPAIARILAALPASAQAVVRIEVENAAEEQALPSPASLDLQWLHRDERGRGALAETIRDVAWPEDDRSVFAWAGCEFQDFKAIRRFLRQEKKLRKDQHFVVAYWRRGEAQT